jgi:glutamate formiminotransferase / formiminotetrahydrofolate cyclodeaminase
MQKIIECVPNFSEGKDKAVLDAIAAAIKAVNGVRLLDVDPGASTNRTVFTLVGAPEAVIEAAFEGIKAASQLIDMRTHKGEHPRMGATDVCPLIPISGISFEETIEYAHKLAKRVGEELHIPVYLYEMAAQSPQRRNLAEIRAGEYEGFKEKIHHPDWKPDYGPQVYNEKSGQTVIGVRDFLVAYNVNLNTQSVKRANSVAFDIREKGRVKTIDGTPNGKAMLDEKGEQIRIAGTCKHVKAIGWYVAEYGIAQVSCNLTNITETPVHIVFDEAVKSATARGMRVSGSELVGLIPKKCLVDAGKYYLEKQKLSAGCSDEDLIHIAVKSLGLDDLQPFDPKKKIIEYCMDEGKEKELTELTITEFNNLLASDAPAPGGGSVSALCGALAASLGAMVANLSIGKKGAEDKWQYFSDWAVKGQQLKSELLFLINEDTAAFNKVMDAFKLPKATPEEKAARTQAIQDANKYATEIPLRVMKVAYKTFEILSLMVVEGNQNSITDAGVGALCADTAIQGAGFNVLINVGGITDSDFVQDMKTQVAEIRSNSTAKKAEVVAIIEAKIG